MTRVRSLSKEFKEKHPVEKPWALQADYVILSDDAQQASLVGSGIGDRIFANVRFTASSVHTPA